MDLDDAIFEGDALRSPKNTRHNQEDTLPVEAQEAKELTRLSRLARGSIQHQTTFYPLVKVDSGPIRPAN